MEALKWDVREMVANKYISKSHHVVKSAWLPARHISNNQQGH